MAAIKAAEVTAVIVTRGDVDLLPVIRDLPFEVLVWDNSIEEDKQCYGRFCADVRTPYTYVQDDDLIIDAGRLLKSYNGEGCLASVPTDETWDFIGGGAIFPTHLPDFTKYIDLYGEDDDFYRVADVVFAYSHPYRRTWIGYEELMPWHDAPNRMYKQPGHYEVRERARDRARRLNEH